MQTYAGIELGGTKVVCGIGTADGQLLQRERLDTEEPDKTLPAIRDVLQRFERQYGRFAGLGIGTFGPVHLTPGSPDFGHLGMTPKLPWHGCDILGYFSEQTRVPVVLDTDVTAAAFGESTWGAAAGAGSAVYVTVGTGIGAGVLIDGTPIHGLLHPEVGHIRVPRAPGDDYAGGCPYHGDCIEGMAAGPAILARWGSRLSGLPKGHAAFAQTAHYLSHLVANVVLFYAPEKIVLGGGVMSNAPLYPMIRQGVQSLLNGYVAVAALEENIDDLIVPPGLGDDAGVLGAIAMAMRCAESDSARMPGDSD